MVLCCQAVDMAMSTLSGELTAYDRQTGFQLYIYIWIIHDSAGIITSWFMSCIALFMQKDSKLVPSNIRSNRHELIIMSIFPCRYIPAQHCQGKRFSQLVSSDSYQISFVLVYYRAHANYQYAQGSDQHASNNIHKHRLNRRYKAIIFSDWSLHSGLFQYYISEVP